MLVETLFQFYLGSLGPCMKSLFQFYVIIISFLRELKCFSIHEDFLSWVTMFEWGWLGTFAVFFIKIFKFWSFNYLDIKFSCTVFGRFGFGNWDGKMCCLPVSPFLVIKFRSRKRSFYDHSNVYHFKIENVFTDTVFSFHMDGRFLTFI